MGSWNPYIYGQQITISPDSSSPQIAQTSTSPSNISLATIIQTKRLCSHMLRGSKTVGTPKASLLQCGMPSACRKGFSFPQNSLNPLNEEECARRSFIFCHQWADALLKRQTQWIVLVSRCLEAAKNTGHFPHHIFLSSNFFQPEEFPKPGAVCLLGNHQQMYSSKYLSDSWLNPHRLLVYATSFGKKFHRNCTQCQRTTSVALLNL